MARTFFVSAFDRLLIPALKERGFRGRADHFVRRDGEVIQVIELQFSIYGSRVTANLGLDLEWLAPAARWIPRPEIGPHAHEGVRWIRVARAAGGTDRWWNFETEELAETAARELFDMIVHQGLAWLSSEAHPRKFLEHARQRVARSSGPRHPAGGFFDLRLLASVLAWNGELEEAREIAKEAESFWPEEKRRLDFAREHYLSRHKGDCPPVPDLVAELFAIIDRFAAP